MLVNSKEYVETLAEKSEVDVAIVRQVLSAIEKMNFAYLSSATLAEGVTIKPMEGIILSSEYMPEKDITGKLVQDTTHTKGKISAKARLTRSYKDKIKKAYN